MSNNQKFQQIRREAAFTGLALLALILFWLGAGFGTSSLDVKIMHLPLWALLGSIGVWAMAIILTFLLTHFVFRDMDFDESLPPSLERDINGAHADDSAPFHSEAASTSAASTLSNRSHDSSDLSPLRAEVRFDD